MLPTFMFRDGPTTCILQLYMKASIERKQEGRKHRRPSEKIEGQEGRLYEQVWSNVFQLSTVDRGRIE
jgi:hypothetical protein